MNREELIMVCCSDLSGQVKGKAFPAADLPARMARGIGWVPTNAQITTFNTIADTPFGALGDLLLIPDPNAEVAVDWGDGGPTEHWFLGNILETDGEPWACCARSMLGEAVQALAAETGLRVKTAFEMEFQFREPHEEFGSGFGLRGFRHKKGFGEAYMAAMRAAGVEPDSFLKEWGDRQYEVTMHPTRALHAADEAVIMREMARATAARLGERISFTPVLDPGGVGNGVHIHMSLMEPDGTNVTWDPEGTGGLSKVAGHFVAGMLHHLPSITCLTAPSVISYGRLVPHRWSAAYNNLGHRDREAAVRICPVVETEGADIASQYHFEFRAGDSAATPHLQLVALIRAGLDGIRKEMAVPEPTHEDISELSDEELAARGIRKLPGTLEEALALFEADEEVRSWFRDPFPEIYLKHKRSEIAHVAEMTEEERHAAYSAAY